MYYCTKRYGHEEGFSIAYRQHHADSHCHFLHGYAIAVELGFRAASLDKRNWVVDFGGMQSLKGMLKDTFDHKLLVAKDDPEHDMLLNLHTHGIADVVVVLATGAEALAEMVFEVTEQWLEDAGFAPRVKMDYAVVAERPGNSAKFRRD